MTEANKRIQFLDISKGIGMMMIVWMHIWGNKPTEFASPELINGFISSIYVPIFFTLSGYLIKIDTLCIKKEIRKKTKSLLKPFVVVYFISFIISFFLSLVDFETKHEFVWDNILNPIYSKTFFNGPLWFLLSLYWGFLLFYFIVVISRRQDFSIIFLSFVIGCIGFYIHRWEITLPLFMGPSLVACPLLTMGYLIKKYISNYWQDKKWTVVISLLTGFLLLAIFGISISMQNNHYEGFYLLFLLSVFGGTIMVLCLSILNERWLKFAAYWGKFSLVILCFHNFILIPTAKIFGKFIPSINGLGRSNIHHTICVFPFYHPVDFKNMSVTFQYKKQ